jgi:hypothetical protein
MPNSLRLMYALVLYYKCPEDMEMVKQILLHNSYQEGITRYPLVCLLKIQYYLKAEYYRSSIQASIDFTQKFDLHEGRISRSNTFNNLKIL